MPYPRKAPPYYGQLFLNDTGDTEGWSEGYWIDKTNHKDAADFMENVLWPARKGLLSSDIQCVQIRVSDCALRGDAVNRFVNLGDKFPDNYNLKSGSVSNRSLVNNLCLWIKISTANPEIKGVKPLRGLPQDVQIPTLGNQARLFRPPSGWGALFDAFKEAMKLTQLVVKTRVPRGLISSATNATPIAIQTPAPHNLSTGARVTIAGAKGNTAANGDWEITVTAADKFTLNTSVGNGTYTSGGRWVQSSALASVFTVAQITDVEEPEILRYRKTGRPFGLLRARR